MKRLRLIILCAFAANVLVALVASAKGILPCMVYRYGLTNEQIDNILEKRPDAQLRLTAQDWRAMRYQLHRYDCMTNYVAQIGSTQDCARVLLDLHDAAETWRTRHGAISNLYAKAERDLSTATERAQEYADAYAGATNRIAAMFSDYTAATNRVARLDSFKAWLIEQRDKAALPTTKALYQAIIDKLGDN